MNPVKLRRPSLGIRRTNNNVATGLMRPRCTTGCVAEVVIWTRKLVMTSGRRDILSPIGPLKTTIIFRRWNCFQIECPTTQRRANYPHPFNPETWIPFQLAEDATAIAKIYDVTGKKIRMIELGHLSAGNYVESSKAIYWDGKTDTGEQVSSGTYFYQIEAGDYTETRKMVILK